MFFYNFFLFVVCVFLAYHYDLLIRNYGDIIRIENLSGQIYDLIFLFFYQIIVSIVLLYIGHWHFCRKGHLKLSLQSFYLQNLKSEQVLNQSLRIFTSLFNFAILMKCLFVRYWLQGCNPCWDIRQRRPVQKTREIQE